MDALLHLLTGAHSFSSTLQGALGGLLNLGPLAGKLAAWFSGSVAGSIK